MFGFFCYFPLQTKRSEKKKDATTPSPALVPSGDYNTLSVLLFPFIFFWFQFIFPDLCLILFVFSYRPAIIITITVKQKHNSLCFNSAENAHSNHLFFSFFLWMRIHRYFIPPKLDFLIGKDNDKLCVYLNFRKQKVTFVLFGYPKARIEGLPFFFFLNIYKFKEYIKLIFFGDRVLTIVEDIGIKR